MKLSKKDLRRNLANLTLVVMGSAIMAIGYALFLIPHHFVPGGVSGIAIIVNYFTRLPVGTLIMVLNIPVFIFGIKIMGLVLPDSPFRFASRLKCALPSTPVCSSRTLTAPQKRFLS